MPDVPERRRRGARLSGARAAGLVDAAIGAALFAATVAYVATWPRDLVPLDEGLFVYESARILAGDVPYRDFFELVTPGAWYLLALLYRVFGVDMATARGMMAVIHGLIVVLAYGACRRLGVRRSLSVVPGAFHMAAGYPTLTLASPHWLSTLLGLCALLVTLGARAGMESGRALVLGLIAGSAIAVQQQKGVWLLLGLACVVALGPRPTRTAAPLLSALGAFGTGAALVLVPLGAYLLSAAGAEALIEALVEFPLTGYRQFHARIHWGMSNPLLPSYQPFPSTMKWLPLAIPLLAARAWLAHRHGEARVAARSAVLIVFCAASVLAILYNPDYTHLAMIAPVYCVAAAHLAETAIRRAPVRVVGPAGLLASGLCLVVLGAQMHESLRVRRELYGTRAKTRFGAVDFRSPAEVEGIEALAELMQSSPNDEVFIYPHHAAVYLMTGTRNPTPFQVMIHDYNTPRQFERLVRVLERKRVRYIALMGGLAAGRADRLFPRYLASHYRRRSLGPFDGRSSPLFERIDGASATAIEPSYDVGSGP